MLDLEAYLKLAADPRLLWFAKKHLNKCSRDEADDMVQNALMAVWRHKDLNIVNLRQYLFIAILHACGTRNRAQGTYARVMCKERGKESACPRSDVHTRVIISQLLRLIPPADRQGWEDSIREGRGKPCIAGGQDSAVRRARWMRQRDVLREALRAQADKGKL